ncbi:hypothetical protein GGD70_008175 [Paraburkholderia fungorum]|nr:hypothetical protein [Paraburkholderia fungorum]
MTLLTQVGNRQPMDRKKTRALAFVRISANVITHSDGS